MTEKMAHLHVSSAEEQRNKAQLLLQMFSEQWTHDEDCADGDSHHWDSKVQVREEGDGSKFIFLLDL